MKGDPKTVTRREVHTYVARGSAQTVADAAQLVGKLPNGWTLHSLVYEPGEGWVAKVISQTEVVSAS